MEDRNLQKQRVLVMYPPSTPCDDLVEWVIDKVNANAFEAVRPPLQIRKCKEFRQISQSVEGIIALCIPFHKDRPQQTSAWIHNWIGAISAQTDPMIPILVIMAEGVDVGGLAKLDDCRCPVVYHWQAEQTEKNKDLLRIQEYLIPHFKRIRQTLIPKIIQVTVVLIDIVAFTSYEFRSEQLIVADQAKYVLKHIVEKEDYQPYILYTSDGGDGGYFVFSMDFAAVQVLQFAQEILDAFKKQGQSDDTMMIKVRIAIDCGGVGQGTSVVNWRRSTWIGPPMNTCARLIGHADANEIVTSERFFQILTGEKYAGGFSEPEVVVGKHAQQFAMRRYTYSV